MQNAIWLRLSTAGAGIRQITTACAGLAALHYQHLCKTTHVDGHDGSPAVHTAAQEAAAGTQVRARAALQQRQDILRNERLWQLSNKVCGGVNIAVNCCGCFFFYLWLSGGLSAGAANSGALGTGLHLRNAADKSLVL